MVMDWHKYAETVDIEARAFIDGSYVDGSEVGSVVINSPVNNRVLPEIPACSDEMIDRAVAAARASFEDRRWSGMPAEGKKEVLLDFAGLVAKYQNKLAVMDALSMGKPVSQSLCNDIPKAIRCYRWFAESIDKVYGECPPVDNDVVATYMAEPLGVIGAITPWNYPVENIAWKLAPALAAGNSVVLKPAERATYSAVFLGELLAEAGVPPGVVNIVPGYGDQAGKALALHADVDGIFFTGSTRTGKNILIYSGQSNMKRVSLECGGKSPYIVLKNCKDLERAADTLAESIFMNQGQTCSAPSRLIIHQSLKERFLSGLLSRAPEYLPGDPFDAGTVVGACVSHQHLSRIAGYVDLALEEGASLLYGGKAVEPVLGGAYMQPTVLDGVSTSSRVSQEEIFGPVLTVYEFEELSTALYLANDSIYGLSGAVWGSDISEVNRIARGLRCGTVHVNCYGEDNMASPFGGFRQSGNGGKEKSLHAIDAYTQKKLTWTRVL